MSADDLTLPYPPSDEGPSHFYRQCWPGAGERDDQYPAMAMAVLDTSANAAALLRLAVRLDEAGSSVRRLVPTAEIVPWFGPHTVLVCGHPARSRVLSRYPRFSEYRIIVENFPTDDRGVVQLLTKINNLLPGTHRLSLHSASSDVQTVVWDPNVFAAGAYVTKDAAFLAGTTSRSLNYLRKRGLLTPRTSAGCYWTFRDVVAVRAWTYLKSTSPRRVSSRVVTSLTHFAGDSTAAQLGVTSNGNVLVDQGNGWVDVESGE
ncbi:MAG: hypothetical protein OXB92_05715, partial [Acidimicrobiaceae bacterium]|nr:hypothetical protein [Acidimicrobiaceae bacterium]